jgi:hypothetical protein
LPTMADKLPFVLYYYKTYPDNAMIYKGLLFLMP